MKYLSFLLFTLPLFAQPKSPEVFGHIGYGAAQGDEGSDGKGAVYGGAIHLPFATHWAFDFDAQHIRTQREPFEFAFGTRRTLLSPAIVYRRGTERLYWFGGGGAGARLETKFWRGPNGEFTSTDRGWAPFSLRTGIVAAAAGRLLVRAEFFAVTSYVVPDAGVQIGIGYRFR